MISYQNLSLPSGIEKIIPQGLRLIAWELTKRCNLACKHCRAEATKGPAGNELTTGEIKGILDDIVSFSHPIIILTGGEPLLREDLLEIASYGTNLGLRMVLATNGTLLDKGWANALMDVGIKRVSISLDGATAKSHDEFRGLNGAFDLSLKGIDALRSVGLDFQINATVTKSNLDEISAIKDLAVKLSAVAYHIFLLVPMGRGSILKDELISAEEYERVLTWLAEQRGKAPLQVKATCAPQYYRILRQKAKEKGEKVTFNTYGLDAVTRGCLGGIGFCFISDEGKVQPCGYLNIECGDVRKNPLSDIWENSIIFNNLRDRRKYKGKCKYCEYWHVCGGCRARAYALTGDYLKAEPLCLYQPRGDTPGGKSKERLDAKDKAILNETQVNFPITSRPYSEIAQRVNLTEQEVLERVKRLKKSGYIRRIGPNFNSEKLGFVSTLCTAKVPKERIKEFVKIVNSYRGVTHNYQRHDRFNIWFTFIAPTMADIETALEEIREKTNIEIYSFPATKIFKIDVKFPV